MIPKGQGTNPAEQKEVTMKKIGLLLSGLMLITSTVMATPVNYTRLNASSNLPSSYVTNVDVQQGTSMTITQASTETNVMDLPAAIAADHMGTTCKSSYNRTRIINTYTTCTRVRCTFGDGSPMQQAQACTSDLLGTTMTNTLTLNSGSDSITFTADSRTVSY